MFLFVGLGNPGAKYELTRHNIGFLVVDEIAASYGFGPFRSRFQALTADGTVGGEKVLLMRPATLRSEPSQARQANQGIDSQIELDMFVIVDL